MMPAKRMRTVWSLGLSPWSSVRPWSCRADPGPSSFGRPNQFVDAVRFIERLPDRQPRAHAAIELAALEQLVVPPLGRDAAAVEHENAIRVPHRRQPVRDDDGG